jgi:hypothetical protein
MEEIYAMEGIFTLFLLYLSNDKRRALGAIANSKQLEWKYMQCRQRYPSHACMTSRCELAMPLGLRLIGFSRILRRVERIRVSFGYRSSRCMCIHISYSSYDARESRGIGIITVYVLHTELQAPTKSETKSKELEGKRERLDTFADLDDRS